MSEMVRVELKSGRVEAPAAAAAAAAADAFEEEAVALVVNIDGWAAGCEGPLGRFRRIHISAFFERNANRLKIIITTFATTAGANSTAISATTLTGFAAAGAKQLLLHRILGAQIENGSKT